MSIITYNCGENPATRCYFFRAHVGGHGKSFEVNIDIPRETYVNEIRLKGYHPSEFFDATFGGVNQGSRPEHKKRMHIIGLEHPAVVFWEKLEFGVRTIIFEQGFRNYFNESHITHWKDRFQPPLFEGHGRFFSNGT